MIGFVSQSNVSSDPRFILLTPGVQLDKSVDGLGQQVRAKSVGVFMKYLSIAFGSCVMFQGICRDLGNLISLVSLQADILHI